MGIETFPEIENFQKLPRQVIVKGGGSAYDPNRGAELRGIVINNIGHAIRDLRVHVVLFENKVIPVLNASTAAETDTLAQGGIAHFQFVFKDYSKTITDYHLYATWKYDDRESL